MNPNQMSVALRTVLGVIGLAIGLSAFPGLVDAVTVDCSKRTIGSVTAGTTIVVKGICTQNLVITVDDVTITTDGVTPATILAANASQPTIQLDGAHRIKIDGAGAGISIGGGSIGISATSGSTLDLSRCAVTGNSQNGVVAAYGSTVSIDSCTIGPNPGNGVVAANTASLVITNSTVSQNTGSGVLAVRSSYIRVGQDRAGTTTVKPVTISGNGANGIAITESSAGTVVGGVVETSGLTNLFVGRGSSGQIGLGSNNLTAGVTIQNGSSFGLSVEGGNATIAFSTITGNALTGIIVSNGGSARIGLMNSNASAPTTVSNNGQTGIHVTIGSAALIGSTTITGNGTTTGGFGRFGIEVFQSSVDLGGDNVISNNAESGIFVGEGGRALIGDPLLGVGTANTISGNGGVGPNTGGVFAFQGGVIQLRDATISNNIGPAVQAFEAGVVELRGSTAVTVPSTGSTAGALVQFGSTLRIRDTASIVSATFDGIQASNLTAVNIRDDNTIQGNGVGGVGIRCFQTAPMTASAVTLTGGNLSNVTGTTGSFVGCNLFQ